MAGGMFESFSHVNVGTLKQSVADFSEDNGQGLGAEMAFGFLVALFPFFIFLAALAGVIGRAVGVDNLFATILEYAAPIMPAESFKIVTDVVNDVIEGSSTGLLSFGAVSALWAAAGGVGAAMHSLNVAYDVQETRPFWKATLVAVGLALGLSLLVLLSVVLYIAGSTVGEVIANRVGLGETFKTVWSVARWPAILLMLTFALALLYYFGPNIKQQFRFITPGATLAAIVWFLATAAFSFYVSHFANYSATYGSIGAVIALMMWFYISGMVLVLGGEINAVIARKADPVVQQDRARKLEPEEQKEKAKLQSKLSREKQARAADHQPAPAPAPAQGIGPAADRFVVAAATILALAAFASLVRRVVGVDRRDGWTA